MTHKTKRVLLVENPNAGASDKQALLKELREGLLSQGFLVEQENKPESIQKCLRAASEENNRFGGNDLSSSDSEAAGELFYLTGSHILEQRLLPEDGAAYGDEENELAEDATGVLDTLDDVYNGDDIEDAAELHSELTLPMRGSAAGAYDFAPSLPEVDAILSSQFPHDLRHSDDKVPDIDVKSDAYCDDDGTLPLYASSDPTCVHHTGLHYSDPKDAPLEPFMYGGIKHIIPVKCQNLRRDCRVPPTADVRSLRRGIKLFAPSFDPPPPADVEKTTPDDASLARELHLATARRGDRVRLTSTPKKSSSGITSPSSSGSPVKRLRLEGGWVLLWMLMHFFCVLTSK